MSIATVGIATVGIARQAIRCEVVAPDVAPQAVRVVAPAVCGAVAHHAARDAVVGHLSRGDVGHEHLGEA